MEKRGISPEEINDKEFKTFLPLHERFADSLFLYKNLKANLKDWDGRVAILGQGDGGRIGAHLATKIENIEGIALLGS